MSLDRDRFADLLAQVVGRDDTPADTSGDGDARAARRLLANALLNYVSETDLRELDRLRDGLPWLRAYLTVVDGGVDADPGGLEGADAERLADRLVADGAVRALGAGKLARHLDGTEPEEWPAELGRLARLDRRLDGLADLQTDELTERLVSNSRLLGDALEICADGANGPENGVVERLTELFPDWPDRPQRHGHDAAPAGRALRILDALESGDEEVFAGPLSELEERARNFERSLARNMGRHGLLEAVRAALAFGPTAIHSDDRPRDASRRSDGLCASHVAEALYQFQVFRDDPPLAALAQALMRIRGAFRAYVDGSAPLSRLEPWARYLRGPCRTFADDRELSYSEATSFGHYCLHLVNICDMAAAGRVTEASRVALMDAEDEIKEFAMAGQRDSGGEEVADLDRYDAMRWAARGPTASVVDRVTRLCGGWRRDVERGPMGAPTRLDPEVHRTVSDALQTVADEADDGAVDGLESLLRRASLRRTEWLETLGADEVVVLVCVALTHARDVPGFDVTRPFCVDLEPLARWWTERHDRHAEDDESADGAAHTVNRRVLEAILERLSPAELMAGERAGTGTEREFGLVARVADEAEREGNARGDVASERSTLQLDINVDDELEALLLLRRSSRADSQQFWDVLETRLDALLGTAPEETRDGSAVQKPLRSA